jgi:hypothetical protein
MTSNESTDDLLFDYRTLRLIVGALAFAFPTVVIALTGKVTTSISASYHEVETRDVFVGFLFIIGALLISYKGHLQGEPRDETKSFWKWVISFKWVNRYQEDIISTTGGFAAIFAALFPTKCDYCKPSIDASIHNAGAIILFSTIVYFCLIAFIRSLNNKLIDIKDPAAVKFKKLFIKKISSIRDKGSGEKRNLFLKLWHFLSLEIRAFLAMAKEGQDRNNRKTIRNKKAPLTLAHIKRVRRGFVYMGCGGLIALDLISYIILSLVAPDTVAKSIITFIVETIALVFFGVAWLTASKQRYIAQIQGWLGSFQREQSAQRRGSKQSK